MPNPYESQERHKIVCVYCKKVIVEGPDPISHGACGKCRDDEIRKIKEYKEEGK